MKQFSELQVSLQRLQTNFDSLISGKDDLTESREKKIALKSVQEQGSMMQDMYSECKTEEDFDEWVQY